MNKVLTALVVLCLTTSVAFSQNTEAEFDGGKWASPYTLAFPDGWGVERFLIPIEFAPRIPYKGVEDIRFTPGWGNAESNEYWTYAFLWYLEGKPQIDSDIIEKNLMAYYTGLVGRNIEKRKIPEEKLVHIKVSIKNTTIEKGDLKTFNGTIYMLDYMQQKPITLNCIVHLKLCPGKDNTFVFYQISPKPYNDKTWESLKKLWTEFDCAKKLLM
jgi:hypothetical protein